MKLLRFIIITALLICSGETTVNAVSNVATDNSTTVNVVLNTDKIIPLIDLNKIEIVRADDYANIFCHMCKLYAPVEVKTKPSADANVIITVVTNGSMSQKKLMMKALATGKPVVAVLLSNKNLLPDYEIMFKKNAPKAVISSIADESLAAQAIFGGTDIRTADGIVKSTRLGYAAPESVGVNNNIIQTVDSLAQIGLVTGAFPGCQVLMARHGKIFLNKNYGYTDPDKRHEVDDFTIYDLASVSKATGTLPGTMVAYDRGMIALDAPISTYIPELRGTDKADITVKELLFHETGMQPSVNLYDIMIDSESYSGELFSKKKDKSHTIKIQDNLYGNKKAKLRNDILSKHKNAKHPIKIADGIWGSKETYDSVMGRIYTSKLRKDKSYAYSCLNFSLLMRVEENASGVPHDVFVTENVYNPIGAYHTGYRPFERFKKEQIAPTEYDALLRRQKVHGYTHDELACFSGGIQGNAGLFSNATDLAKLCQMWLNNGTYGNNRVLSEATAKRFTTEKSPTCRRGLGFDKPDMINPDYSPTCEEADASVYGHIGYTGTIFWVDPKNDMIFIFLCNRVNPTRSNQAFNDLNIRPKLFKAFYQNLK